MNNPISLPVGALLAGAISQAGQGRPGVSIPILDQPARPAPPDEQAAADVEPLPAADQVPPSAALPASGTAERSSQAINLLYAPGPARSGRSVPASPPATRLAPSVSDAAADNDPQGDPPPEDDPLASVPGGTSVDPAGDLSGRLRGLGGSQAGAIIIYGDVHMPAIQNVQPTLDKTQPPLIRGGHENEVPQA